MTAAATPSENPAIVAVCEGVQCGRGVCVSVNVTAVQEQHSGVASAMASESAAGHVSEDLVAWCRCEAGWTGAGCGEVLGQCSNGEVDEASGESDVDCGSAASGCGGCGAGYMCATSGDCLGDLVCYGESGDASGGRCLSPVLSGFGRVVRFGLSLWGVRKSLYGSAGMGEVLLRVLRDVLGGGVEVVVVDVSEEELSAGGGADAAWWRRVLGGVGAGETEGVFLGATVVEVFLGPRAKDEATAVTEVESVLFRYVSSGKVTAALRSQLPASTGLFAIESKIPSSDTSIVNPFLGIPSLNVSVRVQSGNETSSVPPGRTSNVLLWASVGVVGALIAIASVIIVKLRNRKEKSVVHVEKAAASEGDAGF